MLVQQQQWKQAWNEKDMKGLYDVETVNMTSDFGLLFVCILNAGTWDIADVKSCPVTFGTLSDLSRDLGEWPLVLLSEFFHHFLSCSAEKGSH